MPEYPQRGVAVVQWQSAAGSATPKEGVSGTGIMTTTAEMTAVPVVIQIRT
jgi:hypothetical protein